MEEEGTIPELQEMKVSGLGQEKAAKVSVVDLKFMEVSTRWTEPQQVNRQSSQVTVT